MLEGLKRKLRGWGAADDAKLEELKRSTAALLDGALARYGAGTAPSDDELRSLAGAFSALHETLSRRNGTTNNNQFEEDDRVCFYVEALKLTALGHPQHNAWPMLAPLRTRVLDGLRARLGEGGDPWLSLCGVTAALAGGAHQEAISWYGRIAGDPFLADLVGNWAERAVMAFPAFNPLPSYEAFLAATPRKEPWSTDGATGRWVLFAGIFPTIIGDPLATLHDPRPTSVQRLELEGDWDITDGKSARKIIEWLRTEGHHSAVAADLQPDADFSGRRSHAAFVARNRAALARHRALAWDLGRLVGVTRSALAVGYLREDEAMTILDWVGGRMRETYGSWREYGDDYMLGAVYFSPDEGDANPHVAMVRWLRDDPRSPWQRVPFGGASPRT